MLYLPAISRQGNVAKLEVRYETILGPGRQHLHWRLAPLRRPARGPEGGPEGSRLDIRQLSKGVVWMRNENVECRDPN